MFNHKVIVIEYFYKSELVQELLGIRQNNLVSNMPMLAKFCPYYALHYFHLIYVAPEVVA